MLNRSFPLLRKVADNLIQNFSNRSNTIFKAAFFFTLWSKLKTISRTQMRVFAKPETKNSFKAPNSLEKDLFKLFYPVSVPSTACPRAGSVTKLSQSHGAQT